MLRLLIGDDLDGVTHPFQTAPARTEVCEHCDDRVDRVWLVPGDVLNSCRDCFTAVMGLEPVYAQGHTGPQVSDGQHRPLATFYVKADGHRPV